MSVKAGIIGVTGYTGGELLRILLSHPQVEVVAAASRSHEGEAITAIHPQLLGQTALIDCGVAVDNFAQCEVVFLAVPHGTSSQLAKELIQRGIKVVDLGADMRLRDIAVYDAWYGAAHQWPEILPETVYGLPELYRAQIAQSDLVANPGCYPTSVILGLAPLLQKGWVKLDTIVADSQSGMTGSGKGLTAQSHFPHMNDNVAAYKIGQHRHTPEIEQELSALAGEKVLMSFNPHLVPMNRGILSTITMQATATLSQEMLDTCYSAFYQDEPFVRVRSSDQLPQTKWVQGSNYCDVAPVWDARTGRIVVIAVIDNLVKGAAGQAVQNMNIMMGLEETLGLTRGVMYP